LGSLGGVGTGAPHVAAPLADCIDDAEAGF